MTFYIVQALLGNIYHRQAKAMNLDRAMDKKKTKNILDKCHLSTSFLLDKYAVLREMIKYRSPILGIAMFTK